MIPPRADVVVVSSAHELGGAEVYLLALLDGLAQSVSIAVLLSDRAPTELSRRAAAAGASVALVPGLARRPRVAAIVRLAGMLHRRRPALVHVNLSDQGDGIAALAAARLAGIPATATLHLVLPARRRMLEWLTRRTLRLACEVIAVSGWVGDYLADMDLRTSVVPNGVLMPRARPDARAQLGARPGEVVVGGIGRLDRQKGWDILCAAASIVGKHQPPLRFVVIGDGPERTRLQGDCAAGVHFLGYRERAADLIAGMDLLVLPSRYEGFGLVAVEAMLAGVPVVASRVDSLPEVIGEGGVLVAPEDPRALADALIELVDDAERRSELARRGTAWASSRFGCERMCHKTLTVWQRTARPPGSRTVK